jgi:subtilisin family serine protease
MERASERGLALVAAAGNGGAEARPAYPAAHPVVLAVTAVDESLEPYDFANRGDYIDFAAPGVRLWTAREKGGGLQSGTSFAAPFITAAVALHLASGVEPDSRALRKILRRYTKDLGAPGRDAIFGWGLVRIRPNC